MNRSDPIILQTDVLVVGGGGAGWRAALEARRKGVDVIILTKGSAASPGVHAWNVPLHPKDSVEAFFEDTLKCGVYLNDRKLVNILTSDARTALTNLEELGLKVDRTDTGYDLLSPLGSTYPRLVHCEDMGPKQLGLVKTEAERIGVKMKNAVVTSLLKESDAIRGACGIDVKNGDFLIFEAKAVVLATGGGGQLYAFTQYPPDLTCDGYAMAYEIGAVLIDMEFVQFEPCVAVYPEQLRGQGIVTTMLMDGGVLRNSKGEQFMKKYYPEQLEKVQKYEMAQAIIQEINAGNGTEHGGIYFDATPLREEDIVVKREYYFKRCKSVGIDLRKAPVEVAPAASTFMGGVKIDEHCETTVKGLYACGEVVGGLHGANRLGGSAGTEIWVFGSRAGRFAAEAALSKSEKHHLSSSSIHDAKSKTYAYLNRGSTGPINPTIIKEQIQNIMWKHAGPVKRGSDLQIALNELEEIKSKKFPRVTARNVKELILAHEVSNMLETGKILLSAALMRTESRGPHYREDFTKRDDKNWLKRITITRCDSEMKVSTQPL